MSELWPKSAVYDVTGVALYKNSPYAPILLLSLPYDKDNFDKFNILAEIKPNKLQCFCKVFGFNFPEFLLKDEIEREDEK